MELKDIRPDLAQVQAAGPEQMVAAAQEVVDVAQNGVAQALVGAPQPQAVNGAPQPQVLNGSPQALAGSPQSGGVYLFINSAVGNDVEAKSRRARDPGPRRSISWASPSVSQEGGGDPNEIQLATDTGASTEVKVEKLG